nr:hypothetical protein BaRGS_017669 [Batillaria attramentaria]
MEKHTPIQERIGLLQEGGTHPRLLRKKWDIPRTYTPQDPPNAQFAQTPHSSQQRAFRTLSSRKRAPGSTEITAPGAWPGGGFVRINAQARLHDRFYLRTAWWGRSCCHLECRTCPAAHVGCARIEMEVALMAQLQREMGVPVETFTSSGQALPHVHSKNKDDHIKTVYN